MSDKTPVTKAELNKVIRARLKAIEAEADAIFAKAEENVKELRAEEERLRTLIENAPKPGRPKAKEKPEGEQTAPRNFIKFVYPKTTLKDILADLPTSEQVSPHDDAVGVTVETQTQKADEVYRTETIPPRKVRSDKGGKRGEKLSEQIGQLDTRHLELSHTEGGPTTARWGDYTCTEDTQLNSIRRLVALMHAGGFTLSIEDQKTVDGILNPGKDK